MVRGQVLLTQWWVGVIRPLPNSKGYKYAVMCVGACHPDQRLGVAVLEHLSVAYGKPLVTESGHRTHFAESRHRKTREYSLACT